MARLFKHGHALIVGVGQCGKYPGWSLPVTVKDAQALRTVLTDKDLCAFPDDEAHIRLLTDEAATAQGILDGLKWLKARIAKDPEATAIVFYSGHGSVEEDGAEYHLIVHETDPIDWPGSALSAAKLQAALRDVRARRLLAFFDCCHAQGMAAAKEATALRLPQGYKAASLPSKLATLLKEGEGRAIFSSSRGHQSSYIRTDGSLSIYTAHLIEALRGAGSAKGDKTVNVSHLMRHLSQAVPASARQAYDCEQVPFFDLASEDFPVALLRAGKGLAAGGWRASGEGTEAQAPPSQAIQTGAGGQAIGRHATAAGAGGVAVGRDVRGDVILSGGKKVVVKPSRGDGAKAQARTALAAYLRHLADRLRYLPLRGVDVGASDPTSGGTQLELDKLYVDLEAAAPPEVRGRTRRGARRPGPGPELKPKEREKLLEIVVSQRRLVITGDPGSGKSTFLNHLAFALAAHAAEPKVGWLKLLPGWPQQEKACLPCIVNLRDFARWLPVTEGRASAPRDLSAYIEKELGEQNLQAARPALEAAFEEGRSLLLLDGLDEIGDPRKRAQVQQTIASWTKRYPKGRLLVTCRTLSYQDPQWRLEGFPVASILPFSDRQIVRFIDAWYAELARLKTVKASAAAGLARRLGEAAHREDLRELAPSPLLLTVMALVHTHKGALPDARAQLYEDAVDILLWRWEQLKTGEADELPALRRLVIDVKRTDVDLKRALWRLAFEAHAEKGGSEARVADIPEARLLDALKPLHPEQSLDWAKACVEVMKHRAGLLLERKPGVYYFPHRSFQEYLAGAHLAAESRFARSAVDLLDRGAYWREVVLWAVGRLVYCAGDVDKAMALLNELCPAAAPAEDADWRRIAYAGEVLRELGRDRAGETRSGREAAARVIERLAALSNTGRLQPEERARAGDVLAQLGDPRFAANAWCLPADGLLGFLPVEGGAFTFGEGEGQRRVELPLYYAARWPVTVAQFQSFVEATGFKPGDPDCLRGIASHPVVWVSWDEAVGYARWLDKTLREWEGTPEPLATLLRQGTPESGGKPWRIALASEEEWEKAARGPDGATYPWGEEIDPDRANYRDTGILRTTAVGSFPRGRSSYELEDVAGNVWEWTRSPWEPQDKGSGRVLRSGAFDSGAAGLRCALRVRYLSGYRDSAVGVRVVASPLFSDL